MNYLLSPLVQVAAFGTVAAIVAIVFAVRARRVLARTLLGLLAAVLLVPGASVFLAFFPELVDGRCATFKSFFGDIQLGMTREQVFESMERQFPAEGARHPPTVMRDTADSLGFFLNPEGKGEPDCEGIFLDLENGRVTRKDYSRD